ncbi:hypothetical protein MGN70_012233 [Eutypa lata]|nr:hypothetical protein MGN70_012233 [Eutypa lata]
MRLLVTLAVVPVSGILSLASGTPRTWGEASTAAEDFVSQLSLSEKIGIVSGGYLSPGLACVGSIGAIERLNFTGLCFSDGPTGYGRSDGVSVFPSGITTVATWDKNLMFLRGVALGEEFRAKGAHVHLGPSTGPIGRHAQGGRNWEGFGPDPYLAGVAMNASVQGLQSVGVQASSKHFIANEQETQRTSSTSDDGTVVEAISENVDDRTLHELYIWPFADAVRAGTASVMCSYNRVNGSYACANSHTIITILKDELAFPGYVISDWYATHSTASSANAGLDIEMPGNVSALAGPAYFGDALLQNVQNGTVKEARLVEMAERVMTPYFLLGQDQDYPSLYPSNGASFWVYQYGHANVPSIYPQVDARDVRADHAKIIREVGAAGTVLLKNVNGALPLKSEKNVGVFGNDAPYPTTGSVFHDTGVHPEEGYEMGTLDIGGGSGTVRHTDIITPLEAIREQVASIGGRVQVLLGNDEVAEGSFKTIYPVPDVCLLFLNAYATEGIDRASLDLQWNATRAVESTAALCNNTVVIVHGPGVVLMPWADNENVTAILSAHFPGDQTGNSIVDVLWGVTEPSGRLPYSLPKAAADAGPPIVNLTGVTGVVDWQSNFTEGQMIDYRYYDQNDIEPLYEFGFGLSYVPFEMPDSLKIQITSNISFTADQSKGIAPGGLVDLWTTVATATIEVANTVDREASTVPQLFVSFPQDTTPSGTPVKVLRGFETVSIQSGETKEVQFALTRRDLSYWNTDQKQWVIPNGTFIFRAGFSSRDLKSEVELSVLG